jgi:hypothetical protein
MDRATCQRLLGLTMVDVERIFPRCPVDAVDSSPKVYVATEDALAQIRAYSKGTIRENWRIRDR